MSISKIKSFLGAFPRKEVMAALRDLAIDEKRDRKRSGWRYYGKVGGSSWPPSGHDWFSANGKIYVRPSGTHDSVASSSAKPPQKRSTALERNPGMPCPWCGSETFREPLCPACKEGKAGMAYRILCGEDADHVFYVPRDGA